MGAVCCSSSSTATGRVGDSASVVPVTPVAPLTHIIVSSNSRTNGDGAGGGGKHSLSGRMSLSTLMTAGGGLGSLNSAIRSGTGGGGRRTAGGSTMVLNERPKHGSRIVKSRTPSGDFTLGVHKSTHAKASILSSLLTEMELLHFAAGCELRTYGSGQQIYSQGSHPSNEFFLLCSGEVCVEIEGSGVETPQFVSRAIPTMGKGGTATTSMATPTPLNTSDPTNTIEPSPSPTSSPARTPPTPNEAPNNAISLGGAFIAPLTCTSGGGGGGPSPSSSRSASSCQSYSTKNGSIFNFTSHLHQHRGSFHATHHHHQPPLYTPTSQQQHSTTKTDGNMPPPTRPSLKVGVGNVANGPSHDRSATFTASEVLHALQSATVQPNHAVPSAVRSTGTAHTHTRMPSHIISSNTGVGVVIHRQRALTVTIDGHHPSTNTTTLLPPTDHSTHTPSNANDRSATHAAHTPTSLLNKPTSPAISPSKPPSTHLDHPHSNLQPSPPSSPVTHPHPSSVFHRVARQHRGWIFGLEAVWDFRPTTTPPPVATTTIDPNTNIHTPSNGLTLVLPTTSINGVALTNIDPRHTWIPVRGEKIHHEPVVSTMSTTSFLRNDNERPCESPELSISKNERRMSISTNTAPLITKEDAIPNNINKLSNMKPLPVVLQQPSPTSFSTPSSTDGVTPTMTPVGISPQPTISSGGSSNFNNNHHQSQGLGVHPSYPRLSNVVALTECTCLSMNTRSLERFFTRFPHTFETMSQTCFGQQLETSLRSLSWLKHVSDVKLKLLTTLFTSSTYEEGKVLFEEGETSCDESQYYFIASGSVKLSIPTSMEASSAARAHHKATPSMTTTTHPSSHVRTPTTTTPTTMMNLGTNVETNQQQVHTTTTPAVTVEEKDVRSHLNVRRKTLKSSSSQPHLSTVTKIHTRPSPHPTTIHHSQLSYVEKELSSGQLFGELSLLLELDRTATATCTSHSILFTVSRRTLRNFLSLTPDVLKKFHEKLGEYHLQNGYLMRIPMIQSYFYEFCQREFSTENLDFVRACTKFKIEAQKIQVEIEEKRRKEKEKDDEDDDDEYDDEHPKPPSPPPPPPPPVMMPPELRQLAYEIYNNYISDTGIHQVNLRSFVRTAIESSLSTGLLNSHLFSHGVREIYALMSSDSFPRFRKSTMFQTALNRLNRPLSVVNTTEWEEQIREEMEKIPLNDTIQHSKTGPIDVSNNIVGVVSSDIGVDRPGSAIVEIDPSIDGDEVDVIDVKEAALPAPTSADRAAYAELLAHTQREIQSGDTTTIIPNNMPSIDAAPASLPSSSSADFASVPPSSDPPSRSFDPMDAPRPLSSPRDAHA